jgi:hypothetical protein
MQPFHYHFHDYFSDRYYPDSLRFASFFWRFAVNLATTSSAFASFCVVWRRFAVFCGILQRFAAFCCVLRRFKVF